MSWAIAGRYVRAAATDPDAQAYLQAVETADGQALEFEVARAIDNFVLGCKADGIWNAIKASCILAGARTLTGALVPLVGAAPTNFNFVSGDYNRKTGLEGNGSSKYLNSNRNNNADPQDSNHNAVWVSTVGTLVAMGVEAATGEGSNVTALTVVRNRINSTLNYAMAAGFVGHSRSQAPSFVVRSNGSNTSRAANSQVPQNSNVSIFRGGTSYGTHRLAFYSIGESLDLALLDARVTALIQTIDAAI